MHYARCPGCTRSAASVSPAAQELRTRNRFGVHSILRPPASPVLILTGPMSGSAARTANAGKSQACRRPSVLRHVFFLRTLELFVARSAAFKSRQRKTTGQIVRRLKVRGFRIVNHARPVAELIRVPFTDDHLDFWRYRWVGSSR